MSVIADPLVQKAVANIKQRSEKQRDLQKTVGSFVDIGILSQILCDNSQVIYGRRGTGKTHLLSVLRAELKSAQENRVLLLDCRTLGSSDQWSNFGLPIEHRCLALFRDILSEVHDELLEAIVEQPNDFSNHLLALLSELENSIVTPVGQSRVSDIEHRTRNEAVGGRGLNFGLEGAGLHGAFTTDHKSSAAEETVIKESIAYSDKVFFPAITGLLQEICDKGGLSLYVLLDEWSSLPTDIQPYLAEFLKRGFLPVNSITLKIASLEYRSNFSIRPETKSIIGFETGADIATGLDLDDHFVFDRNKEVVTKAFADILHSHLQSELPQEYLRDQYQISDTDRFIKAFFTNSTTAFQELARAAEGVARDLINIFSHAFFTSQKKGHDKIEKRTVTEAAQQWFEQDKARELAPELSDALSRIVKEVIGGKKARSFLAPRDLERDNLLQQLFDSRVLHLVTRGYADKDNPGVRYNIYTLDYGTYVNLLGTSNSPHGFEENAVVDADFIVPFDDRRSIRRIILTRDVLYPPPGLSGL